MWSFLYQMGSQSTLLHLAQGPSASAGHTLEVFGARGDDTGRSITPRAAFQPEAGGHKPLVEQKIKGS